MRAVQIDTGQRLRAALALGQSCGPDRRVTLVVAHGFLAVQERVQDDLLALLHRNRRAVTVDACQSEADRHRSLEVAPPGLVVCCADWMRTFVPSRKYCVTSRCR
jgi:hypothetical protein